VARDTNLLRLDVPRHSPIAFRVLPGQALLGTTAPCAMDSEVLLTITINSRLISSSTSSIGKEQTQ
jgi:hypothetical protein